MPVFNIKKKSILLTVSSLVISQFMSHASNFDELDLKKLQTPHQTYNFEDLFDLNKISKVERSTSREPFDWFFNFDNYKISAPQKAKVNPNSFDFDIFMGMAPRKAQVQEAKVNPNFFDIFTGIAPQKVNVQETKVNPNSFDFDIFTGITPQKVNVQETKVNPNSFDFDIFTGITPQKSEVQEAKINSNFFDFFNFMISQKNENHNHNHNHNQEFVSELKALRTQLEVLTTQHIFDLNALNKIPNLEAQIVNLEKLLIQIKTENNDLFGQLGSGSNDRSKKSNSNNNDANKSILNPIEEKIEIFKNNSKSGAIQLTSTGSEKAPIIQLMEYIDQSNDKQGAEKLITHLMEEQNSSDPDRAKSIENILNNINSLPKIIRDAHEAQIRKHDQDKMKSICDEGARIEINEVEKFKQVVSKTFVTQINPASCLVLFTPQQLSKMDLTVVDEIKNYFSSLPVDYRKIIFKNLSSEVSGDKIQIVRNPNNKKSLQILFSSLYESFSQPEKAFVVSSNGVVRGKVEKLTEGLIKLLEKESNVILTPLDPTTPPPPPPTAKKAAGAPPPPPPAAKKGPVLKPAAAKTPALAEMKPVVLTDGVASIIPGLHAKLDPKGEQDLSAIIRGLGYTPRQVGKICKYMMTHLGTDARTAVNTLIINATDTDNSEFLNKVILAGT